MNDAYVALLGLVVVGSCISFVAMIWNMARLENECESLKQQVADLKEWTAKHEVQA